MKKILIFGFIGCLVTSVADAEKICVNLTSEIKCTSNPSDTSVDWRAVCGNSINIYGVGRCSYSSGDTTSYLPINDKTGTHLYCWCKMVAPVVSNWVRITKKESYADECAKNCSYLCSDMIINGTQTGTTFRKNMFSSMMD